MSYQQNLDGRGKKKELILKLLETGLNPIPAQSSPLVFWMTML